MEHLEAEAKQLRNKLAQALATPLLSDYPKRSLGAWVSDVSKAPPAQPASVHRAAAIVKHSIVEHTIVDHAIVEQGLEDRCIEEEGNAPGAASGLVRPHFTESSLPGNPPTRSPAPVELPARARATSNSHTQPVVTPAAEPCLSQNHLQSDVQVPESSTGSENSSKKLVAGNTEVDATNLTGLTNATSKQEQGVADVALIVEFTTDFEALPAGWKERKNCEGKTFYFHTESLKSKLRRPSSRERSEAELTRLKWLCVRVSASLLFIRVIP